MGYYLDLRFDLESIPDWQTAVDKLCAAGAKVLPWEEFAPDFLEMTPEKCKRLIQLDAPELPFIMVCKEAEGGELAYVRLSWGTGSEFVRIVSRVLAFAKRVGCRVYDGQGQEYVTEEALAELAESFSRSARQIIGLFGQVTGKPSVNDDGASEDGSDNLLSRNTGDAESRQDPV